MTDTVLLKIAPVPAQERELPIAVHKFTWTRVGKDITLDVGYFNLPEIRAALDSAKERKEGHASLRIVATFSLSTTSALDLLRAGKSLVDDLVKQGMVTKEEVDDALNAPLEDKRT